ncbi:hypothetical protein ACN4EG_21590 [Alkalinema pantanalense CENA528]|uniref:hypothetical protein n=1 Tax=Alkalinema pantanalense TaxID=1620705 RepID=UPI003D6F540F
MSRLLAMSRQWLSRFQQQLLQWLVFSLCLWILTACSHAANLPTQDLLERAISLQVERIQATLSQQLQLPAPTRSKIQVRQIEVQSQIPLLIEQRPAYHLRGTYDLIIKQSGHTLHQPHNPFDVYLQQRPEEKTWHFAEPSAEDPNRWTTRALS